MIFWLSLYLFAVSGAILLTNVVLLAELHPLFILFLILGLLATWHWWQDSYGEIYPRLSEIFLKSAVLLAGGIGCAIAMYKF